MIENLIIQNTYKKGRVNSLIYNSEIGFEYLFSLLRNNSIIALGFYYFDTSTSFQIVQNGIYKIKVTAKNIYSNETKDFFSDDFKVNDLSDHIDKVGISIFGSCVSRDALNVNCETNSKLFIKEYIARQSIVSSVSKPLIYNKNDVGLDSNFQKRMVENDLLKNTFELLINNKSEYLLIDMFEERFDLFKAQNTYFTASDENITSGVLKDSKNIIQIKKNKNGNYFVENEPFVKYIKQFVDNILSIYSQNEIIIHKAYLIDKYYNRYGKAKKINKFKTRDIDIINKKLDFLYNKLIELMPEAHIIDVKDNFIGDERHIWGLASTHYQEEYYNKVSEEIAKIIFNKKIEITKQEHISLKRNSVLDTFRFLIYSKTIKRKSAIDIFKLLICSKKTQINSMLNTFKLLIESKTIKANKMLDTFKFLMYSKTIKNKFAKTKIKVNFQSKPNIAFICDQMTWDNFSPLCNAAYLTPDNFIETFKEFKPDFLFCEATWRGIEEFKNCWRTKVYKNRNLYFENRQALLQIIKYCNENNIKTVFWNKEDPYFINENRNNFFDTALLFDYIFTTAEECIPYYKNEGKNKVFFLPFSFAPWIFNPLNRAKKNNNAIFTGSWYNFAEERIDDTCKLFDYLLDNGYNLKIYDRNKKRNKDKSNFPKKYSQYIESAVPYSKTGELYRANDIAVNINTIKYSESMFARRVFEIMACATGIISNESKAMRMTFGNNVAFIDDKNIIIPNKESIRSNLKKVFKKYTVNEQFDFLCNTVLGKTESSNRIFVFCYSNIEPKFDKNRIIFQKIDSSNQLLENIKDIDFKLSDYAILVDNSNVDFEFLASQFLFIPQNVGVKETNDEHYYIIKSKDINNVLFKADNFKQIVLNTDEFDVYLA